MGGTWWNILEHLMIVCYFDVWAIGILEALFDLGIFWLKF